MRNILKILTQLSRFIIGIVFVYSGFVKLVDPIGTKIKMTEYFGPDALGMEFFIPFALPISIMLILAELVLGIMVLIGFKPKLAVWSTFLLSVFFLFLTWFSLEYNVVKDCGCFGDAITLTNEETFYKNIVFTCLLIIMIIGLRYIKPLFNNRITLLVPFVTAGIAGVIAFYCLNHLPIIDFRAYAVGVDIAEAMKSETMKEGDTISSPKPAKIEAFKVDDAQGVNHLSSILKAEKALLIVIYDIQQFLDYEKIENVKQLYKRAEDNGYLTYILVDEMLEYSEIELKFDVDSKFAKVGDTLLISGANDKIEKRIVSKNILNNGFKITCNQTKYSDSINAVIKTVNGKVYENVQKTVLSSWIPQDLMRLNIGWFDKKVLKTVVRASPGVITIKNGVIDGKWNINDSDDIEFE